MKSVPATSPARSVLPLVGDDVAAAAQHGTFCPKMCSFACPVTAATGRDDATPWSFHRTVDDLASGRLAPSEVGRMLDACTGCHACRDACAFEQDVPAQVRAGRAAVAAAAVASGQPMEAEQGCERVRRGRSPYPVDLASPPDGADARADGAVDTVVVAGCRELQSTVDAHHRLLSAAGVDAAWLVPEGCCGAAVRDLGGTALPAERETQLGEVVAARGARRVVALDPHCLPSLRRGVATDVDVVDAVTHLVDLTADGHLQLQADTEVLATYHDPCLLARDEGVVDTPRELLRRVGVVVVDGEDVGTATRCSGGGMAMPLLAPDDAALTADRRAQQLRATGTRMTVTACSGAHRRLADAGLHVVDLYEALASGIAARATDAAALLPQDHPRHDDGATT